MWGTRGSLAAPGPETARYGGNTACVEVRADDDTLLILDGGTGIRRLGQALEETPDRVDMLLTHLHLDHIQGLGFFDPLFVPDVDVHIWGPAGVSFDLHKRLTRYLSPPLFPIHLRSLPCRLELHEVPDGTIEIGPFRIETAYVCHPGPTVGYRIEQDSAVVTYLPDHEPALGSVEFPEVPEWTSGYDLAEGSDLLIHDAQYTDEEYDTHVGWGHSSISHAIAFADLADAGHLVAFHHDPTHGDDTLDRIVDEAIEETSASLEVSAATEESIYDVDARRIRRVETASPGLP